MQPNHTPAGSRRSIRRSVQLDCQLVATHSDEPLDYCASDLSQHGVWIHTREPIRTGSEVVVCLTPNNGWHHGELLVFAEVARVSTSRQKELAPGVGMGLEFVDLTPTESRRLGEWLRSQRSPVPRRKRPVRKKQPTWTAWR
jgi:hypothetical protein